MVGWLNGWMVEWLKWVVRCKGVLKQVQDDEPLNSFMASTIATIFSTGTLAWML